MKCPEPFTPYPKTKKALREYDQDFERRAERKDYQYLEALATRRVQLAFYADTRIVNRKDTCLGLSVYFIRGIVESYNGANS